MIFNKSEGGSDIVTDKVGAKIFTCLERIVDTRPS